MRERNKNITKYNNYLMKYKKNLLCKNFVYSFQDFSKFFQRKLSIIHHILNPLQPSY